MAREGLPTPSTPGRGEATQVPLEQGLASAGCRREATRIGLAEEHLPSVVWDLRSLLGSQQGHPGRSGGGCTTAPCSDHFHQLSRDRSRRCKSGEQAAGLDAERGLRMAGRGGLHLPVLCGEGALGAATKRGTKPALGSGAYKPPDRHSSATGTHTHALDHGRHCPADTDESDVGGRRRWGGQSSGLAPGRASQTRSPAGRG